MKKILKLITYSAYTFLKRMDQAVNILKALTPDQLAKISQSGSIEEMEKLLRLAMIKHKNKIYPNEKCPCGSGIKYKKCCFQKIGRKTSS